MKGFVDEMAACGKPLEDEDFVFYVLAGLTTTTILLGKMLLAKRDLLGILVL
jgi:hypothetical protein